MNASRIKHGVVVAVAIALLAGAALSATSAFAAKGGSHGNVNGGGHGKNSTPTPSATLTYSPNPVTVGGTFTVQGAGWAPNSAVSLGFWGGITLYGTTTDSTGAFSFTWPETMNYCGSSLFDAIQGSTTVFTYINITGC